MLRTLLLNCSQPVVALHVGTGSSILCPVSGAVRKQMDVAVLPAATRMTLSRHEAGRNLAVQRTSHARRAMVEDKRAQHPVSIQNDSGPAQGPASVPAPS